MFTAATTKNKTKTSGKKNRNNVRMALGKQSN